MPPPPNKYDHAFEKLSRYRKKLVSEKHLSFFAAEQGDQKNWKKNHPIFQKVAQTVSDFKKAKFSTTKLNLKAQNIYINHFWNLIVPTTNHILKLLI